jgi:hypothetical protein
LGFISRVVPGGENVHLVLITPNSGTEGEACIQRSQPEATEPNTKKELTMKSRVNLNPNSGVFQAMLALETYFVPRGAGSLSTGQHSAPVVRGSSGKRGSADLRWSRRLKGARTSPRDVPAGYLFFPGQHFNLLWFGAEFDEPALVHRQGEIQGTRIRL